MDILSRPAMAPPLTYGEIQKRRDAALAAAAERRRDSQAGAARALSSARFSGAETVKSQSRAKLQAIRERLTILKQLYSANPKEMAGALAQIFKEMKALVKAFKDAGGQEMALSGETVRAVLADDKTDVASTGDDADQSALDEQASSTGASLYDDMVRTLREAIGVEGLDFIKEVRGMADKIKDLLETARGQARIRKPDKDTDEVFEDADKALKDLHKALSDMEDDIRRAAPTAGMKISVAA